MKRKKAKDPRRPVEGAEAEVGGEAKPQAEFKASRGEELSEEEEADEDEDSDDFDVVINPAETSTKPSEQAVNPSAATVENIAGSKATIDLITVGMLNGKSIFEVELDDNLLFSLQAGEERPWRKAGADPTDYFNYGFTEQTWRQYCLKQRALREEYAASGTGKRIAILDQMGNAPKTAGMRPPFIPVPAGMPGLPPPAFLMQHLEAAHSAGASAPRPPPPHSPPRRRSRSPPRRSYDRDRDYGRDRDRDRDYHRSPSPKRRR